VCLTGCFAIGSAKNQLHSYSGVETAIYGASERCRSIQVDGFKRSRRTSVLRVEDVGNLATLSM